MRAPLLRTLGALALLLASGCTSWTFDGSSPDVILSGEPPAAGTLPRLNGTPATNVALMLGGDGAPYAAISEIPVPGAGTPLPQQVLRLVRLTGPATEEVVQAVQIGLTGRALFVIELSGADPMGPVVATARGPEGPEPSQRFMLPGGNKLFGFGGRDQVFFVWVQAAETRTFQVLRRDGKPGRTLPVLPGVDPARPTQKGRLFFDASGEILYTQDGDNRVVAHATGEERDVDLGVLSRAAAPDG